MLTHVLREQAEFSEEGSLRPRNKKEITSDSLQNPSEEDTMSTEFPSGDSCAQKPGSTCGTGASLTVLLLKDHTATFDFIVVGAFNRIMAPWTVNNPTSILRKLKVCNDGIGLSA